MILSLRCSLLGLRLPFVATCRNIKTSHRYLQDGGEDDTSVTVKKEVDTKQNRRVAIHWPAIRSSWKHIQKDVKNRFTTFWKQEQIKRYHKHDHIIYYFRTPEDLKYWYLMTDEDVGGYSWAELRQGKNEMTAMFRGNLSSRRPRDRLLSEDPLAERPPYRGFAFLETKPFKTVLDKVALMSFLGFNMFKLRIRGDGRKYQFETMCDFGMGYEVMYTAPIYTNGGPLWQEVTIPFCKLIASRRNVFLTKQTAMDIHKMTNFRFLLSDGIDGPFQLEIDYIAFERDLNYPSNTNDNYDPWAPINANSS